MKKGIKSVLSVALSAGATAVVVGKRLGKRVDEQRNLACKHLTMFQMMNQWVKIKQNGKNVSSYFEQQGYKEIAIYGMHFVGETLVEELMGSGITIKYGIDKNANKICADFDIITPDSPLKYVDAIVVTAITYFDEIEELLKDKVNCPIISLEDILWQM